MRKRMIYFITVASISCLAYGCSENTMINVNTQCSSDDDCKSKGKGYQCDNGFCRCHSDACKNTKPEDPKDPTDPKDPVDPKDPKDPTDPPTPTEYDKDGDTIEDIYDTCDVDTDGNGKVDCEDDDSDGDTIPDSIEGQLIGDTPADSDYDGIYDFLDTDSDDNGIPDSIEAGPDPLHPVDTDGNGTPDYQDPDNDGNYITDTEEIAGIMTEGHPGRRCGSDWCPAGSAASPWDTDNNGVPDYNDPDNDGDGIPDTIESTEDTDKDGELDIYSQDSNGDGVLDRDTLNPDGTPASFTNPETGETIYCYRTRDCDGDALIDKLELNCDGQSTAMNADFDQDGYIDGAEYAAAQYAMAHGLLNGGTISKPEDLVCNPNLGVKDVFEFYFVLPYGGDKKDDDLPFYPEVKQLDIVFNVDTTASMDTAINNVKKNISSVISSIKGMVKDSGFALTNFDDFPVLCPSSMGVSLPCGFPGYGDLPFRVLGSISTDAGVVASYTQNNLFTTRAGADEPESGVESLYQIATGEGVSWSGGSYSGTVYTEAGFTNYWSWNSGSIPAHPGSGNKWGGVDFRKGSLPIIIHTTDAPSHDKNDGQYISSLPSSLAYLSYVPSPHYSGHLIPVLKSKGIRVITLSVPNVEGGYGADQYGQMAVWSQESNAVVPVCAFEGACGNNVCCLGSKTVAPQMINGRENQCVLTYQAAQNDVSSTIVKGVDALVKYGTYDVATKIRGDAIPGASVDTSCFVKQVVASKYIAPPNEPEHSCNPVAIPNSVGGAGYNNGFTNFAPGTSSADKKGAELHFTVYAQNDNCIEAANESQVFTAYIEVYDPTTGLSFGERKVSIIVPPGGGPEIN